MPILSRGRVLLMFTCMAMGTATQAQQDGMLAALKPVSGDVAVTYAAERGKVAPGSCGCFWYQGGGVDGAVNFAHGVGIAAALNGDHASNYAPGLDISKITFLAGPRYTYSFSSPPTDQRWWFRRLQIFGQALFGGVHGFDGTFPSSGAGVKSSAGSFAFEAGAGASYSVTRNIHVRLLQVDYVRTELPNSLADTQNDLRLSIGISYHVTSMHLHR